ncbi:hypothetical protein FGG08_005788 [Glutinoglossum americanum]|uniref:dolichyl-phosphate beta-glucosyltransferase n=1 Tax=Glutinoglossum americanum TaxID=1670608 RepID=A0A9P8I2C5_9PEZI|nr:hypothetical protein FGG08_005788 [Glutinoglossum americanum]
MFRIYVFVFAVAPIPRPPRPSEKTYKTILPGGSVSSKQGLPCWMDHDRIGKQQGAEVFVSVVVPAYNEEERLGGMLEEAVDYLQTHFWDAHESSTTAVTQDHKEMQKTSKGKKLQNGTVGKPPLSATTKGWEILIVSDGSTDKTVDAALSFARSHQLYPHPKPIPGPRTPYPDHSTQIPPGAIRVISLEENRGKGGAVVHGMRHVRGEYIVFADADGASKFSDLGRLVGECQKIEDSQGRGVAVGSRAHLVGSEAVVKRSFLRNFLMHSFHLLLRILTPTATAAIKDTQCGFKLFSRSCLPYIIPFMHSEGWIFDVEMLMLAELAGIPVAEVPVGWKEVGGSKLNVIWDSLGMAWGLAVLRAAWVLGVYRRD